MKKLISTFAIGTMSLFLCSSAPARPQEPDKDKQQEPDKEKSDKEKPKEPKPKPEKPADTTHPPKQQEPKPNEEPKSKENRPDTNRPENRPEANRPENRPEANRPQEQPERGHAEARQGQGNANLTQRTGHHNSYRIPDDRFHSGFGREHVFHVDHGAQSFFFGGYSFQLVDPWPEAWAYSDDVYIEFIDGEYYLVDAVHPGVRVLVIVVG